MDAEQQDSLRETDPVLFAELASLGLVDCYTAYRVAVAKYETRGEFNPESCARIELERTQERAKQRGRERYRRHQQQLADRRRRRRSQNDSTSAVAAVISVRSANTSSTGRPARSRSAATKPASTARPSTALPVAGLNKSASWSHASTYPV